MSTIMDYLDWRGDLSFNASDINEVDALIFSLFNYVDINIKDRKKLSIISKSLRNNIKMMDRRKIKKLTVFNKKMIKLFLKASHTKRFGNIELIDVTEKVDEDKELQFQAMTFLLDNGDIIITYKGTDNSLLGYKEDFNMSFNKPVLGQVEALKYLKRMLHKYDNNVVYVAGHSKGGNFAVYAVSGLDDNMRSRIEKVYNFDGPGFTESVLNSDGYKKTLPKIKKFIPRDSVVGILMEDKEPTVVVEAFEKSGFKQHDGHSWHVKGNKFVKVNSSSKKSMFFDKTMKMWIDDIDYEDRKKFVNSIYRILKEDMDITRVNQLDKNKIKYFIKFLSYIRKLEDEERVFVQDLFLKLIKSGAIAGKELS